MPADRPTKRPIRAVLYVDDSDHWHAAARLVGAFIRAVGGHVTVTASLLLPGARTRAMEHAREMLGLEASQVDLLGKPGIIEYTLPEVARQTHADVLVVGRLGSADRLTSGLIGHLIAKRTPTSVVIARGRPKEIRRILVCTQGARHGLVDIACAIQIARAFDATLDVLHVASQMGLTAGGMASIEEDLRDFVHSSAPEATHLREVRTQIEAAGVAGSVMVRAGLVVEEIVDAVREGGHDLLVIGAHDVEAPGGHLYEDLGGLILRASPVSTLVVRDTQSEPVHRKRS